MRKTYTTPSIEVTKWECSDVITTSGVQSVSTVPNVTTGGEATVSIKYNQLPLN